MINEGIKTKAKIVDFEVAAKRRESRPCNGSDRSEISQHISYTFQLLLDTNGIQITQKADSVVCEF